MATTPATSMTTRPRSYLAALDPMAAARAEAKRQSQRLAPQGGAHGGGNDDSDQMWAPPALPRPVAKPAPALLQRQPVRAVAPKTPLVARTARASPARTPVAETDQCHRPLREQAEAPQKSARTTGVASVSKEATATSAANAACASREKPRCGQESLPPRPDPVPQEHSSDTTRSVQRPTRSQRRGCGAETAESKPVDKVVEARRDDAEARDRLVASRADPTKNQIAPLPAVAGERERMVERDRVAETSPGPVHVGNAGIVGPAPHRPLCLFARPSRMAVRPLVLGDWLGMRPHARETESVQMTHTYAGGADGESAGPRHSAPHSMGAFVSHRSAKRTAGVRALANVLETALDAVTCERIGQYMGEMLDHRAYGLSFDELAATVRAMSGVTCTGRDARDLALRYVPGAVARRLITPWYKTRLCVTLTTRMAVERCVAPDVRRALADYRNGMELRHLDQRMALLTGVSFRVHSINYSAGSALSLLAMMPDVVGRVEHIAGRIVVYPVGHVRDTRLFEPLDPSPASAADGDVEIGENNRRGSNDGANGQDGGGDNDDRLLTRALGHEVVRVSDMEQARLACTLLGTSAAPHIVFDCRGIIGGRHTRSQPVGMIQMAAPGTPIFQFDMIALGETWQPDGLRTMRSPTDGTASMYEVLGISSLLRNSDVIKVIYDSTHIMRALLRRTGVEPVSVVDLRECAYRTGAPPRVTRHLNGIFAHFGLATNPANCDLVAMLSSDCWAWHRRPMPIRARLAAARDALIMCTSYAAVDVLWDKVYPSHPHGPCDQHRAQRDRDGEAPPTDAECDAATHSILALHVARENGGENRADGAPRKENGDDDRVDTVSVRQGGNAAKSTTTTTTSTQNDAKSSLCDDSGKVRRGAGVRYTGEWGLLCEEDDDDDVGTFADHESDRRAMANSIPSPRDPQHQGQHRPESHNATNSANTGAQKSSVWVRKG